MSVFFTYTAGDGQPYVFAANFGEELAVNDIAVHGDLLVFDHGHSTADVGVRRESRGTRTPAEHLSESGTDCITLRIRTGIGIGSGTGGGRRCRSSRSGHRGSDRVGAS